MNQVLIFEHERKDEQHFAISDSKRIDHVKNRLNKKSGEELKICLVNEGIGKAKITHLCEKLLEGEISELNQPSATPLKLVVAVSRPPTLKKILEHGTSLGVSEFHFYCSKLTEKSYLTSKVLNEENQTELLKLGLAQAKNNFKLPRVYLHRELPREEIIKSKHNFLLEMNAEKTLADMTISPEGISFALGPERGLTTFENQYFKNMGFLPIQVSKGTLRVEIACFAALSQAFLFTN